MQKTKQNKHKLKTLTQLNLEKISLLIILPTSSVKITLSSNMHKSQSFRNTPIENTFVRDMRNTNEATEASAALKGKH